MGIDKWAPMSDEWVEVHVYSHPIVATQHCLHINFDIAQSCIL